MHMGLSQILETTTIYSIQLLFSQTNVKIVLTISGNVGGSISDELFYLEFFLYVEKVYI